MDHESKSDYDNIESEASSESDTDWMTETAKDDAKPVKSRLPRETKVSARGDWKALTYTERDWIRNHGAISTISKLSSEQLVSPETSSTRMKLCGACNRSPEGRSLDNLVAHYRRMHNLYIVALKNGKFAMFTPDEMAKCRSEISAGREGRLKQVREEHRGTTAQATKVGNKWECPYCPRSSNSEYYLRRHGKKEHPNEASIEFAPEKPVQ